MAFFNKAKGNHPLSLACQQTMGLGTSPVQGRDIIGGRHLWIPIWFVYKDGSRIDLNHPNLIVEDWSGQLERARQLGLKKIRDWERLSESFSNGKIAKIPNIVFYA